MGATEHNWSNQAVGSEDLDPISLRSKLDQVTLVTRLRGAVIISDGWVQLNIIGLTKLSGGRIAS